MIALWLALTLCASVAVSAFVAWRMVEAHARGSVVRLRHRRGRPPGKLAVKAQLDLPIDAS